MRQTLIALFFITLCGISIAVAVRGAEALSESATVAASDNTPLACAPIGTFCRVQLRRDAVGAKGAAGSLTATSINGDIVSVGGWLRRLDKKWVVLENAKELLWIPQSTILLLRQAKADHGAAPVEPAVVE